MPTLQFPTVVSALYPTVGTRIPNPSVPLKEGVKTNTLVFTGDSGHEQRRDKSDPKRVFDPSWNALFVDQYLTIRDFYLQVRCTTPFLWTHPIEKTQFLVRFTNDVFHGENKGYGPKGPIYTTSVNMLQVWG